MIRIEISQASFLERPITAKNGKTYVFREQTGYAYLMGPNGTLDTHPSKFAISLERDAQPYPAGNYTVEPSSLYVNKYGGLDLGRLRLKSIEVKKPALAA